MTNSDTSRFATANTISILLACLFTASCVVAPPAQTFCNNELFLIDTNFEGGNFNSCRIAGEHRAVIGIRPENAPPINQSPWYSFRISPRRVAAIQVVLQFEDGYARYWPKTSPDKTNWTPLPESSVQISDDGKSMTFLISLHEHAVYVSAQELVTTDFYYEWIKYLDAHRDINAQLIGHSVQGRPIYAAKSGSAMETVILIGRQHPPEISGALAMRSFADTVFGESELARRFRERYSVIIVPLINPDGVAHGHWRHNVNGVDLNRDWGPFTQPETQSVAALLEQAKEYGISLKLMLDFHSTRTNTFYTQLPEESNYPFDFATVWLDRVRKLLPEFEFKHDARAHSGQANTKNYFYDTYGIPAITYELGDETDRNAIRRSSPVFAVEMMRTLLELE